ncbi:hypothetical protein E3N88_29635 [Mikania micrantha]|uniref:Uncharacterized protein n=1 Tax=Mikania micrantha TaxID=192012 RepID=A0A5N6MK42_9ASTR|nr:hypothetical protein E3N88_29635 [Mikania micrantha]
MAISIEPLNRASSGVAMPHDKPEEMRARGYHMISGAVDVGLFRGDATVVGDGGGNVGVLHGWNMMKDGLPTVAALKSVCILAV